MSAATETQTSHSPVVTIQAGREGVTPVFCFPGAGANITCFVPLTLALGPDVPVYGLQARGLDGQLAPHTSVEAAASAHVQAMKDLHLLNGPCKLVGHSFGGWIAFEAARLLRAEGRTVDTLVLLDSNSPSALGPRRRSYERLDALLDLVELIEMQVQKSLKLDRATLQSHTDAGQISLLHQAMVGAGVIHVRTPLDNVQGLFRVFMRNLNTTYVPASPIDVPVILAQASEHARDEGHARAWADLAPVGTHLSVPGNHMTLLMQPHIDMVAQTILSSARHGATRLDGAVESRLS
jgi:syringomycin synthetase protein SyrE